MIKITGNQQTYDRMSEDMGFNAGPVLTRVQTFDQAAQSLQDLVVSVAGGQLTKPEQLGHREYFVMYKHQNTPGLTAGCPWNLVVTMTWFQKTGITPTVRFEHG